DAGQRMLSAPPQGPLSTRASTSPPSAGAGSASRTATARTLPRSPAASPAFPPALHRPAPVASCSRTAAAPHRHPAPPINPPAPAEPPQHHHVEPGTPLVARERQLGEHVALVRRDVMRRPAVQRGHEHVAPARVAPAEPREPPAQLLVLALRHFE